MVPVVFLKNGPVPVRKFLLHGVLLCQRPVIECSKGGNHFQLVLPSSSPGFSSKPGTTSRLYVPLRLDWPFRKADQTLAPLIKDGHCQSYCRAIELQVGFEPTMGI